LFNNPLLEARHISKTIGDSFKISDLSFALYPGDVMCVVDVERHSASLLLRIFAGLVPVDSGEIRANGEPVAGRESSAKLVGFMSQSAGAYEEFSIQEYMSYLAASFDIDPCYRPFLIGEALGLVKLNDLSMEPIENISELMRRRLALARAILNAPRVLVAEEPFSNLDYAEEREFVEIFKELRRRGRALVISTANARSLEDLCTHVCLIIRGRVFACGALDSLSAVLRQIHSVQIQVMDNPAAASRFLYQSAGTGTVDHITCRDNILRFIFVGSSDDLDVLLKSMTSRGIRIISFSEDLNFLGNFGRHRRP
jgi:ABC-2 type transport system ATP-binding protein